VEKTGQLYRLGIWAVKPDKASDFIAAWQNSTEWLVQHLPDERGGAVLLEDANDANRFMSFAEVSNLEKIEEVMTRAVENTVKTVGDNKEHCLGSGSWLVRSGDLCLLITE
jgi:hypothetical protein